VRPPQPDGVYAFTQRRRSWNAATGEDRYRRGLYTLFYRSAPYPMMTTFDTPDFQSVCTARPRSNTPLQSLTLANDEAFFEMAQGLAARLLREVPGANPASDSARVDRAFRICYSRKPSESERDSVTVFVERQTGVYREDPKAAEAVAPGGTTDVSRPVAAAWTAACRALLNTDEFITRE